MPSLTFVVLAVAIGVLALIPTRRLFVAGWSSGALSIYYLALVGLGILVAELRGPARYLIPIFVLAYIAPFITARNGIGRIRDRMGGRPEPPRPPPARPAPRNVTPPPGDRPTGGSG